MRTQVDGAPILLLTSERQARRHARSSCVPRLSTHSSSRNNMGSVRANNCSPRRLAWSRPYDKTRTLAKGQSWCRNRDNQRGTPALRVCHFLTKQQGNSPGQYVSTAKVGTVTAVQQDLHTYKGQSWCRNKNVQGPPMMCTTFYVCGCL
jgi:hypothetical protein